MYVDERFGQFTSTGKDAGMSDSFHIVEGHPASSVSQETSG